LPSGGIRRSGLSFKTILIIGVIYLVLKFMGIDPLQMLGDRSRHGPDRPAFWGRAARFRLPARTR
jgi:hypothetical protein